MASSTESFLHIAYMNIRGQTGLSLEKQIQIENFVSQNEIDILHCQEIDIGQDTFKECNLISSSYNLVTNNSQNKYGTASFVKNEFSIENIKLDTSGRIIIFDIENLTFGNFYLPSGTDGLSRSSREKILAETIPQLLVNAKDAGCLGGDFNCIINKVDATRNPESKLSPSLKRLVKTFSWQDSFRALYPSVNTFSRYYDSDRYGEGATRIDRSYHFGGIKVLEAKYSSIAFSDHMVYTVKIQLPEALSKILSPKSRPLFKTKPEVIQDPLFQERLQQNMNQWLEVKSLGVPVLNWWEGLVKPGIKRLAINRSKEMNKEKRGELNLLLLRQAYLTRKLHGGNFQKLAELKTVQLKIIQWYESSCEKVKHQARMEEVTESEKVSIYHHDLHQKHIRKSSILKLETDNGIIEGHHACADFLEKAVGELLLHPAELDNAAQARLLNEVETVFTEEDNAMLCSPPSQQDVKDVLSNSNLHAAPGSDGITSFLYSECWEILGKPITEVMQAIHDGNQPTASQRTSLMVFGSKPKKANSIKPGDKRKISLLNSDFKIATGLEAMRFKKVTTHSLSVHQLVAGENRRIHHGVNLARDAISAAGKSRNGCGILDTDYLAAFDYLVMHWVFQVLSRKGLSDSVISRLKNLYKDNTTIVVVNNVLGKSFTNHRWSLRQGDVPSMYWFAYGIDPLLDFLDKRLNGILIHSLPVHGPSPAGAADPLPPLEQRYKVVGYADDLKPAITSMQEFALVDTASALFEKSSGCKLHRDPKSGKCKFLPLGRWRGTLTQEDIPFPYMVLSEYLDMVGVELKATATQTRKANGDILQSRIKNTIGPWQAGKFMTLTQRPWSLNNYALSKLWYKCNCIDMRAMDISFITSKVKAWLYADQLEKPEEIVLYRPASYGGLGLHHVQLKAQAMLIRSFLETATNPNFLHSLYHNSLYRFHVLLHRDLPEPASSPFYSSDFFSTIREVHENSPLNVARMTSKQWYLLLVENKVTMELDPASPSEQQHIQCRAEVASPANDWERTWYYARLKGIGPDMFTFLWRLLHRLLPTQDRVHRIIKTKSSNSNCQLCQDGVTEDLQHAFFQCSFNTNAGDHLTRCLSTVMPGIDSTKILILNFDLEESDQFPCVWFASHLLYNIWNCRAEKKRVRILTIRADLEARANLLRETRFSDAVPKISLLISLL